MTGGTSAEHRRNSKPYRAWVSGYVPPHSAFCFISMGIKRRGWERSVSELLSPRVPPVPSSLRGSAERRIKCFDHTGYEFEFRQWGQKMGGVLADLNPTKCMGVVFCENLSLASIGLEFRQLMRCVRGMGCSWGDFYFSFFYFREKIHI